MRNLSEDEASRMMGLEDVGDVYQGADGHLYEWVAGVDGDGEQVGFWQGLSLSDAPALDGLGALYATPDGTVYQVQGLGDEEADPKARAARKRPGPPPPRPGPGARGGPPRKKGGFFKKLLPIAKFASRFIPVPGAGAIVRGGIDVAAKLLKKPGVAGYDGVGALYAAPDGTIYRAQDLAAEDLNGLNADDELRGFDADDEPRGLAADDELRGFDADDELRGFAADDELRGFDEDEALRGSDQDPELRGLEQGYVREDAVSGLDAYVPVQAPATRWFTPPSEPPKIWKPLW